MPLIDSLIKEGWLKTPRIIEAFKKIKRVDFLPSVASATEGKSEDLEKIAELNEALPIGYGQTISQPLVVAFMLEQLNPQPGDKILDIGSGSGWTSALLGEIVGEKESPPKDKNIQAGPPHSEGVGRVIAIEITPELKEFGENNTAKYNFVKKGQVQFFCADGSRGYENEAPYDKILVSASVQGEVPGAWKQQLKVGGRIVTPIGSSIWLLVKNPPAGGETDFEEIEYPGFSFVPLIEN
jgi:protein-L-isoaspartate(D-aspartate) O-methyltransferase